MTITHGYATLAQIKARLGIADIASDALLEDAVTQASRVIDGYCGRRFWADSSASSRDYLACHDGSHVATDDLSTVTGATVTVDANGDGIAETVWQAGWFVALPRNGVRGGVEGWPCTQLDATSGRLFPARGVVSVAGKWGWAAVPAPVTAACLSVAAAIHESRNAPFGVAGSGEYGVFRVQGLDRQTEEQLRPYRSLAAVA